MKRFFIAFTFLLLFFSQNLFSAVSASEIQALIDKCKEYEEKNDYKNALKQCETLLFLYKKNADSLTKDQNDFKPHIYFEAGDLEEKIGDYTKALEYFENALELFDKINGRENIDSAASLQRIANIYIDLGKIDESISKLDESLLIVSHLYGEENDGIAYINQSKAIAFNCLGRYDESLKCLKIAEKIFEKTNNIQGLSYVWQSESSIFKEKGDFERATIYSAKALESMINIVGSDNPSIINFLENHAIDLWDSGNYFEGMTLIGQAVNLSVKYGIFTTGTARVIKTSGTFFASFGKGGNLEEMAKNDKSLQDGLKYNYSIFNDKEMKSIINTFYPEYNGVSSPEDIALLFFKLSMALTEYNFNTEYNDSCADCYNRIGCLYSQSGQYTKAQENFEKAITIKSKLFGSMHSSLALYYSNLANNYYKLSKKSSALETWRKAFVCWKKSINYSEIINQTKDILSLGIQDKDFTQEVLSLALDTIERSRFSSSNFKGKLLKKALPIFYYGVQFAYNQNDAKKAFEYAEAMKSRSFLEQMGTEYALRLDGISEKEREEFRRLSEKIELAEKRLENQNQKGLEERNEKEAEAAAKDLSDAEKKLAELDAIIAKRIPRYASLRNPVVVNISQAKELCSKDDAIIEYVMWSPEYASDKNNKQNSYCIVITNKNAEIIALDSNFDYSSAVNTVRSAVIPKGQKSNGEYIIEKESNWEKTRNSLYKNLITPFASRVSNCKNLMIVPDGNLSFLPFDILREKSTSKMIFEQFSCVLSPSVSVSALLEKHNTDDEMLAFGGAWYNKNYSVEQHRRVYDSLKNDKESRSLKLDVDTASFNAAKTSSVESNIFLNGAGDYFSSINAIWPDLPGTLKEVNAINREVFSDSKMFVQKQASEKSLKLLSDSGELSKFSIIHFACHGYFDNNVAEMCSVVFSEVSGKLEGISSDDGYLTVPEVSALNLNADMVCLSACETGLGEIRAGDGIVGLSRGFMVAGAQNVGVSLWQVDDEATAEFMVQMYKKHRNGLSYPDAYRSVKSDFIKNTRWSSPFFWAAFSLYGGIKNQ